MLPNAIDVTWCETHQAFWDGCPDAKVVGFVNYTKNAEVEETSANDGSN